MELIAIGAVAVLAWWLWRRHGRRSAEHRAAMGYGGEAIPDPDTAGDWRALLDRTDVLIVDTETTGLGERAEVIEVAVLDTAGTVRFEALSLPVGRIPRGASDIHGLTRERLAKAGARPWPDVHRELVAALEGAAMVLAWNADFDRRLLRQTADRHGLTLPRVLWRDLLPEYRAHHGERPGKGRHTLARAVEREGAKVSGRAHRAAGDCRAVLAVMRAVAANGKA